MLVDEKSLRISDIAFCLFLRHGYRKVTMSDIAEAAGISRPTLYSVFKNKEDIFSSMVAHHNRLRLQQSELVRQQHPDLPSRLEGLYEIWVLAPVASLIDIDNGKDLIRNCSNYVPQAIESVYACFQEQLSAVLAEEMATNPVNQALSAPDLAHILTIATKGLRSTSSEMHEFRRMVDGLIAMTLTTVSSPLNAPALA